MKIDILMPFVGDYAEVGVKFGKTRKYGIINRRGDFVIQPKYEMINYDGGEWIRVNIGYKEGEKGLYSGKWGVINLRGEVVIPFKYSDIFSWGDGVYYSVCYRNRWGVISYSDKAVIPFKFGFIGTPDCRDWIYAELDGKVGYLDRKGQLVVPFIYDEIIPTCTNNPDDWFAVRQGNEWHYINQIGERMIF